MAYDEGLAHRIREQTNDVTGLTERKMFGGLSFLLEGNLAVGVIGEDMIVRVGPEHDRTALEMPSARSFDFTGRKMKGWVMVAPDGTQEDEDLQNWIKMGLDFAATLPPK